MVGQIHIDGEVGLETTLKSVRAEIAAQPNAKSFDVFINSIGGDVYDGYAIGAEIMKIGKPTTARIQSLCASIATYISSCCDKVTMTPHGDFVIHDPMATVQGRAGEFRKVAEQLDRIKSEIIQRYMTKVSRKGVTNQQLADKMAVETSLTPQEALELGFIDEIEPALRAVAKIDISKFITMKTNEKDPKGIKKAFFDFGKSMNDLFKSLKITNQVEIALADGTMATSDAETPDAIQDSTLIGQDGQPLAPGNYETADGYAITVGDGGVVTAYGPITADKAKGKDQTQALQKEIETLKAQLAEKDKAVASTAAASAKREKQFTDTLKDIKAKYEELSKKTFGDDGDPNDDKGPTNILDDDGNDTEEFDPMKELADTFVTSRQVNFKIK